MLIIPTTKEVGTRFRPIIRIDRTEFHLAGLYESQLDAMDCAQSLVKKFEADIRASLKKRAMFQAPQHGKGAPR